MVPRYGGGGDLWAQEVSSGDREGAQLLGQDASHFGAGHKVQGAAQVFEDDVGIDQAAEAL